ncbi:hypothetical protein OG21DRAFT_1488710 [Imleria badia]|nr:hypothetical protein OG21DRAFT_1488710 [Imleria badia]
MSPSPFPLSYLGAPTRPKGTNDGAKEIGGRSHRPLFPFPSHGTANTSKRLLSPIAKRVSVLSRQTNPVSEYPMQPSATASRGSVYLSPIILCVTIRMLAWSPAPRTLCRTGSDRYGYRVMRAKMDAEGLHDGTMARKKIPDTIRWNLQEGDKPIQVRDPPRGSKDGLSVLDTDTETTPEGYGQR